MKITPRSVTQEDFARFGKAVTSPTDATTSEGPDYKFWSDIASYSIKGETEIGICTVYAQAVAKIDGVERHLRTPEILIPIDGSFYLPLLLEGDSEDQMAVFRVNMGEAVVIDEAVWHGACLPVRQEQCSYFVIFRSNTPHDDVEHKSIDPVLIA